MAMMILCLMVRRIWKLMKPLRSTNTSILVIILSILFTGVVLGLFKLMEGTKLNYFYSVIWERGPIQFFELLFGFMVVGHLIQKVRLLKAQRRPLISSPVDPTIDLGYDEEVTELRQDMRSYSGFDDSILLTRIDRALAQWLGGRALTWCYVVGAGRGSCMIHPQTDHYPVVAGRLLCLGLSERYWVLVRRWRVSPTSSVVVALDQIKVALQGVTKNLGTAFDTTLLALVLSVVITIPLTAFIRRENEMLSEFDTFIDDLIISRLPPPEPASIKIENLEDSIDAAFRRYIPDPDRYDEVFSRAIDKAADTVQEKFNHLTNTYEDALAEVTKRLAGSLGKVTEQVEESMQRVVASVVETDKAMVENRKEIATEETNRLGGMLDSFQDRASTIATSYQERAESLETSTREGMDKSIGAATQLAVKLEEIREMAGSIDKLLQLEASVEKSLKGLSTSEEFRKTLDDLRGHLATTDEFCQQMAKPRVITLTEELIEDE